MCLSVSNLQLYFTQIEFQSTIFWMKISQRVVLVPPWTKSLLHFTRARIKIHYVSILEFHFHTNWIPAEFHFRHFFHTFQVFEYISSIFLLVVRLGINSITVKQYIPKKSGFLWICSKFFVLCHGHDYFWPTWLCRLLEAKDVIESAHFGTLNSTFGSSHSASSAYQKK